MINKLAAAKSATNAYQKIQVPIGLDGIIDGRPFGNVRQGSRIFYWAYPHNVATGGQKQMYRHVDTLNSSGFDAYIFHNQDGFRLSWFDNDTRVVGPSAIGALYRPGDVLVLPEDLGPQLLKFRGPKVIFNQNVYYGYGTLGEAPLEHYPYQDTGLLGVITVSEHNRDSLAYAFPDTRVLRVVNGIDLNWFRPVALANKSPVIATIMKGNSTPEVMALFHMLNARSASEGNPLQDFGWTFI